MKTDRCIVPLGGAAEVGANAHYLKLPGGGVLFDAGMHPKRSGADALPRFDLVDGEVDAVVVTHAHLDHVGALPVALRRFPRSRVLMTEATALLSVRMLRNAVAVSRHRDVEPLFGHDAVDWVDQVIQAVTCGRAVTLQPAPGVRLRVTLYNAGHILGAAGVLVEVGGKRLFYTGDTCESSQYLCRGADYPEAPVDLLVLDCTHGADEQPALAGERGRFWRAAEALGRFVSEVADRGGSVLIPLFAMGRAQEILGVLAHLMRSGKAPPLPLHLSGLAHAVCRIYDATRRDAPRYHPELALEQLDYRILRPEQIDAPSLLRRPAIFGATSGMLFEDTAAHRLAARILPDPNSGLAVVGYLDPDSPGYRIAASEPDALVDIGRARVVRRCDLRRFPFTAHSRAGQLLHTVETLRPNKVLLVHGDQDAVAAMHRRLTQRGVEVEVAEVGRPVGF